MSALRSANGLRPAIDIGYRAPIDHWTRENLAQFDVLEITVDHCIGSGESVSESGV